jgi:hypothetical protein
MFDNGSLLRRRKRFKTLMNKKNAMATVANSGGEMGQDQQQHEDPMNETGEDDEENYGFDDEEDEYPDEEIESESEHHQQQSDELDVSAIEVNHQQTDSNANSSHQIEPEVPSSELNEFMPETDNQKLSNILFKKTGILLQSGQTTSEPGLLVQQSQMSSQATASPLLPYNHMLYLAAQNYECFNKQSSLLGSGEKQQQQLLTVKEFEKYHNQTVTNATNGNIMLSPKSLSSSSSSFLSSTSSASSCSSSSSSSKSPTSLLAIKKNTNSFSIDNLINNHTNTNSEKSSLNKLNEQSLSIKKLKKSSQKKQLKNGLKMSSHREDTASQNMLSQTSSSRSSCNVSPISPIQPINCYTNFALHPTVSGYNNNNSSQASVSNELVAMRLRSLIQSLNNNQSHGLVVDSPLNASSPLQNTCMKSSNAHSPSVSKKLEFMHQQAGVPIMNEHLTTQQSIYNAMLMRVAYSAAAAANTNASSMSNYPGCPQFGSGGSSPLISNLNQPQPPQLSSMQQFLNTADMRNFNLPNILPLFMPMHS